MGLTRKKLLVAATEGTYGTSASPVGADAILVEDDLKITPLESDSLERKIVQPYFGAKRKIVIKRRVKIEFSVELAGSGAAGTAPKYGKLLTACAFGETVTAGTSVVYSPVTANSDITSVTLAFHADGQKHLATGCRGNVKFAGKLNEIPKLQFEFTGIYNAPTDTSIPTPTFSNQAEPLVFNQSNTTSLNINGFTTACLESLDFDMKNNVVYRELVGCTKQVIITDRRGEGSLMIEAPSIDTYDAFNAATTSAVGELSFVHGAEAGNIVEIGIPTANFGAPSYGDSDGLMMLEIPFGMLPTSAGNDEVFFVFT